MENILLIGLDIHEYVKTLCDNFCYMGITPDMTEREELAYKAGVNAALSLLEQTLDDIYGDGEPELIVHLPGVKDAEDFYSIDEIIERMNE